MSGTFEFLSILVFLVYAGVAIFVLILFLRVVKAFEKIADTYERKNISL